MGTTQHKNSYGQSHYKCISLFGISPNLTFLQRPGIDPIGHFSLPSGPLDTKVCTDSPITNLFCHLGSVPTVHFIETWDRSHRSFFFAIGTTQHKSLYGQSHNKCILLFGISPNRTFLQRPGIDPIGHFSLPYGPIDAKVRMNSPITNLFCYLGSVS